MYTLLIYIQVSSALFYLGSRALITRWLWSRYPHWFATFADCPACVGFWWGFALAILLGVPLHLELLGLSADDWRTPFVAALCSLVMTPIVAGIMQWGLDHVGHAVPQDESREI